MAIKVGDTILFDLIDILESLLEIVQPGTDAEEHLKALRNHEGKLVIYDERRLTVSPTPCKEGQTAEWGERVRRLTHKLSKNTEYIPVAVDFPLPPG